MLAITGRMKNETEQRVPNRARCRFFLTAGTAHSEYATTPRRSTAFADEIAREIALIRGLEFKEHVRVENQSAANFGEYVSQELDEAVPSPSGFTTTRPFLASGYIAVRRSKISPL